MRSQTKGTLMILTSAAGFATLAIFIKYAYAAGANMLTILSVRFSLAALLLWPVLKWRGLSLQVDKDMLIKLCLMGIAGYGSMSMLFAGSLQYLPASLSAMLLYTYPALVCILSFLLGDEIFTWQKGSSLAICFIGLFMVLGVSFANIQPLGVALGLGSSLIYSCYLVAGNRLLNHVNSLTATFYICLSAGLCLLLFSLATGSFMVSLPPAGWLSMAGITFFATVIAMLFLFAGMNIIGASHASIISTTEPVITVLLSMALLNEKITLWQAGGGMLILIGIIILQLWAKDNTPQDAPTSIGG